MIHPKPEKLTPNLLLPSSSIGNTFSSFFPYLFNWIHKPRQKNDWLTENRYPLTARSLWEKHQDTRQVIGVRFGDRTEYAMIDIDRKSPNHPLNSSANYDRVLQACAAIGLLEPLTVRSSASEGLHLYFPLPHAINTFSLACGLRSTLEAHRLEIASGILEIFPNTKAYDSEYNAHRLPLQDSSYIVRHDLHPISNSIERFCERWIDIAECQDFELLGEQIAIARSQYKPKYVKQAKLNGWKDDLESILSQGWTGHGQTNDLVHKVAQYARVFVGLDDLDRLIQWVTDKVTSLNGFDKFCNHKHNLLKRVRDWSKWVFDRNFPMGNKQSGEEMAAQQREHRRQDTLNRIETAARSMCDRGITDMSIRKMAASIAKTARCSVSTLYEVKQLWHPEHKQAVTPTNKDLQPISNPQSQQTETLANESQPTVTQNSYEVLGRDSSPVNSSNFDPPPLQPLAGTLKLIQQTKITLLEGQIRTRQQGRMTGTIIREIEELQQQLAKLKNDF